MKNSFRLFQVIISGKGKLFRKLSHLRLINLLDKSTSIFDTCYTKQEIDYLGSKLF